MTSLQLEAALSWRSCKSQLMSVRSAASRHGQASFRTRDLLKRPVSG